MLTSKISGIHCIATLGLPFCRQRPYAQPTLAPKGEVRAVANDVGCGMIVATLGVASKSVVGDDVGRIP